MKNKKLYTAGITILCFALVFTTFALFTQDAQKKEITINFGEILELSISELASVQKNLNPDEGNDSATFSVKLGKAATNGSLESENLYGKFYIELEQTKTDENAKYLIDELEVSAEINGKIYSHNDVVKTDAIPAGFTCKLTEIPEEAITITYSLTETAKANFFEYADQSVTIKMFWVFAKGPTTLTIIAPYSTETYYYELWIGGDDPYFTGSFAGTTTITVSKDVTHIRIYKDEFDTHKKELSLTEDTATLTVDSNAEVTLTQP